MNFFSHARKNMEKKKKQEILKYINSEKLYITSVCKEDIHYFKEKTDFLRRKINKPKKQDYITP